MNVVVIRVGPSALATRRDDSLYLDNAVLVRTPPITRAASVIRIQIRTWPPPRVHRIVISDRSGSGMAGSGRCAHRSGRPRTTVILPDAGWQASRKFGFREAGLDTAAVAGDATAGGRCPAGRSDARMGRKMDGRKMHRSFGRRRKFGPCDRPPSFCRFAGLWDRIERKRTGVFRMIGAETNPPIRNVDAPQIRRGEADRSQITTMLTGRRRVA
jgi:hypothetical protein